MKTKGDFICKVVISPYFQYKDHCSNTSKSWSFPLKMSVKIISTIYYIYWVIVYAILSVKGFLIQLLYKEEIVLFYKY